jgi:hypothetical protein
MFNMHEAEQLEKVIFSENSSHLISSSVNGAMNPFLPKRPAEYLLLRTQLERVCFLWWPETPLIICCYVGFKPFMPP